MAGVGQRKEGPAVLIYQTPTLPPREILDQILWGVEEEGVPARVVEGVEGDATKIAHQGAQDSQLGVGLGIDGTGAVVLHYYRLPLTKPLFFLGPGTQIGDVHRRIGCNAARLVKGIPFKSLEPQPDLPKQTGFPPSQPTDLEAVVRQVVRVVVRVLAEENHRARR